jgi:hypothetical protein
LLGFGILESPGGCAVGDGVGDGDVSGSSGSAVAIGAQARMVPATVSPAKAFRARPRICATVILPPV